LSMKTIPSFDNDIMYLCSRMENGKHKEVVACSNYY
jgi:hypothetical protein